MRDVPRHGAAGGWIGPDYFALGREPQRLLVLAERQPSEAGALGRVGSGFEAELTSAYVSGSMKHRLFTDVARAVLGGPCERPACEAFWNSVAFSNLVSPSGGRAGHPAMTPEDWNQARAKLTELARALEPKSLLVLGETLRQEIFGTAELDACLKPLLGRIVFVRHPASAGFAFREHVEAARILRSP